MERNAQSKALDDDTKFREIQTHLSALIKWDGKVSKKGASEVEFATKFGDYIIKLIVQILEELSSNGTDTFTSKLKIIEFALKQLDKIKTGLQWKSPFDVEKYWYKLSSKCISAKKFDAALEYTQILLDRLHQVQQKEYSLYSKTSSKNLVPGGKEPVDFVTYVVSVHVQRANSLNELGKDPKPTIESALIWVDRLKELEPSKALPYYDSMFCLLYKTAVAAKEGAALTSEEIRDRITLAVSAVRILQEKQDMKSLFEQTWKIALHLEKLGGSPKVPIQFYQQVFHNFQKLFPLSKLHHEYLWCLHHNISSYQKIGDFAKVKALLLEARNSLNLLPKSSESQTETHIHVCLLDLLSILNILHQFLRKDAKVRIEECNSFLNNINQNMQSCITSLQFGHQTNDQDTPNYSLLIRVTRTIDELRKFYQDNCSTFLNPNPKVEIPSSVLESLAQVFHILTQAIEKGLIWDEQPKVKTSKQFIPLVANLVDSFDVIAQITFEINKKNIKESIHFLDKALQLITERKLTNGLKYVAVSYYNFGVKLFNLKMFQDALSPIQSSCDLFLQYSKLNGEIDKGKMSKRLLQLSTCKKQCGDLKGAYESVCQAIQFSDLTNEVPTKLIERFVSYRASLPSGTKVKGLIELLHEVSPPLSKPTIGVILEDQLKYFFSSLSHSIPIEETHDVINQLLDIYQEEKFPVRRARILIEKAKLLRASAQSGDSEDAQKAQEHLLFAIKLLKRRICLQTALPIDETLSKHPPSKVYELCMAKAAKSISSGKIKETKQWLRFARSTAGAADKQSDFQNYILKLVKDKKNDGALCKMLRLNFLPTEDQIDEIFLLDDLAAAYTWLGIVETQATGQTSVQPFYFSLILWSEFIERASESEKDKPQLRSPEYTLSCLKILNDFLGLLDQTGMQIYASKLIILFEQKYACENSEHRLRASCLTYGLLANLYQLFGKSKIASSSIEKAQKLEIEEISLKSNIFYCRYLFQLEEYEQCETILRKLEKSLESKEKLNREDRATLGSCKSIRSSILHQKGDLVSALHEANEALTLRRETIPELFFNTINDENGSNTSVSLQFQGYQLNQWALLRDFLDSVEQSGKLYELIGDCTRAEMHYKIGLDIARVINASNIIAKFLGQLFDLASRSNKSEESEGYKKDLLNVLKSDSMQIQQSTPKLTEQQIQTKLIFGDDWLRKNEVEEASELYQEALSLFQQLQRDSNIPSLNQLKFSTEKVPKVIQVLRKNKHKNQYLLLLEGEDKQDEKIDLSKNGFLQSIESLITLKKGKLKFLQGELEEAETLFKKALEHPKDIPDKLVILYYLGQVYLQSPANQKQLDACWNYQSTNIVPSKEMQMAKKNLTEAFKLSSKFMIPQFTRSISRSLAMLTGRQNSEATAYYIDCSLGITARNQARLLSLQKLKAIDKQLQSNSESDDISEIFSKEQVSEKRQQVDESLDIFDLNHFSHFSNSIQEMPEHWTLCSLSLSVDCGHAFITRANSNNSPLTVRISLQSEESGKDELDEDRSNLYFELRSRFDQIMEDSKKSHVSKDNKLAKSKWNDWWETRANLDQKLGRLLFDLENVFLAHFKTLLCGSIVDGKIVESLKKAHPRVQLSVERACGKKIDESLMFCFFQALPFLSESEYELYKKGLCFLMGWDFECLDSKQQKTLKELSSLSENEYLEATGKKDIGEAASIERHPVILVLDSKLQPLPWESMAMLQSQQVCRMPCLSFIKQRAYQFNSKTPNIVRDGVDFKKTFFVLNPGLDLESTQSKFETYFSDQGWKGISAREPFPEEIKKGLTNSDLYIFCGHGSGVQYCSSDQLQKLDKVAVALLMGCSSGALRDFGEFEPYGVPISYLLAGCPAVVGNLWDVTDGDLDRYCDKLLKSWIAREQDGALLSNVQSARNVCKLRFLVGAAPVCYGIPVHIRLNGKMPPQRSTKPLETKVEKPIEIQEEEIEKKPISKISDSKVIPKAKAAKAPAKKTMEIPPEPVPLALESMGKPETARTRTVKKTETKEEPPVKRVTRSRK